MFARFRGFNCQSLTLVSLFLSLTISLTWILPGSAGENKPTVSSPAESQQVPVREVVTLFTGINRSREVYEHLKELAPHMKADGDRDNWTRIVVVLKQGGKDTTLTINNDREYYAGKSWQVQRMGMYNYFSKFPEAQHKQRALRLIQRLNFAVAAILKPARLDDDERLKLILQLAQKSRAVMFAPGSLMDSYGRIIISADGYSDPEARVDL